MALAGALAKRGVLYQIDWMHNGAGVLADRLIIDKTGEQFDRVYGTKIQGLRAILDALVKEVK